jgi:hypothetical protein
MITHCHIAVSLLRESLGRPAPRRRPIFAGNGLLHGGLLDLDLDLAEDI